jgi:hypothetical protein
MLQHRLDIAEASRCEHSAQPWFVTKAEGSLNRISQLWLMPSGNDVDATIIRPLRHGQNGYRHMPTWAENPMKFGQTPLWVREEHQPEATYHRVEGGIGEPHGLAIRDTDLDIGSVAQPETGLFDHESRSVSRGDVSVRPNDIQRCLGGEPGSGGDIHHLLPNANSGGAQEKWNEMAGYPSHRIFVTPCCCGIVGYFVQDLLPVYRMAKWWCLAQAGFSRMGRSGGCGVAVYELGAQFAPAAISNLV